MKKQNFEIFHGSIVVKGVIHFDTLEGVTTVYKVQFKKPVLELSPELVFQLKECLDSFIEAKGEVSLLPVLAKNEGFDQLPALPTTEKLYGFEKMVRGVVNALRPKMSERDNEQIDRVFGLIDEMKKDIDSKDKKKIGN